MKTKIIEATQPNPDTNPQNWGRFMVCQFDIEDHMHHSEIAQMTTLAASGYGGLPDRSIVWVLDLVTREGGCFRIGGSPKADLDKHKIWVCPLFEPFLGWLYENFSGDVLSLPDLVEVSAEGQLFGHRRAGN